MSHLRNDLRQRAEELVSLYPRKRSAMLPLLHLAQEQDGYLSDEGIAEVAELTGTTPADVRGTAAFYDMYHLAPVGKYVVGVCTNIACLLAGGEEMLEHAEQDAGMCRGLYLGRRTLHLGRGGVSRRLQHRAVRASEQPLRAHDDTRDFRCVGRGTESRETRSRHSELWHAHSREASGGLRASKTDVATERSGARAAREKRDAENK